MPTSKKRTTRRSGKGKPRTPKEEAAQKEVQANGVIVALTPGENGGEVCNFQLLGKTTQRELPTLLAEAKKAAEQQLGLG